MKIDHKTLKFLFQLNFQRACHQWQLRAEWQRRKRHTLSMQTWTIGLQLKNTDSVVLNNASLIRGDRL